MAAAEETPRRVRARIAAAAILGGLIVLFAVLNSQSVSVHLLATTVNMPLIVVIAVCGAVGVAIGWLASRHRARRQASETDRGAANRAAA